MIWSILLINWSLWTGAPIKSAAYYSHRRRHWFDLKLSTNENLKWFIKRNISQLSLARFDEIISSNYSQMATYSTLNFAPMFNHQQKQSRKNLKRRFSVQKSIHRHLRPFGKVSKSKIRDPIIELPSFSLLGGNRYDPLNLNQLNEMSNRIRNHNSGNDPLVEILLPPNIHDPLCLDSSPSDHLVPFSNEAHSSQPENDKNSTNYQREDDWFISPYSPWNFNDSYYQQRLIFTDMQPITHRWLVSDQNIWFTSAKLVLLLVK